MKTNLQVLNEISAKLGGREDALVVVEALNNIANALGDTEPDRIKTISESLEDILQYIGGGDEPLFSGNITTEDDEGYNIYSFEDMLRLNYDSLKVEFEGSEYTLPNISEIDDTYDFGEWTEDGDPVFTTYPLAIHYEDSGYPDNFPPTVYTETAGTYSLKIWEQ